MTTHVPDVMSVLTLESMVETREIASTDEIGTSLSRVTIISLMIVMSVGLAEVRVAVGVRES